MARTYRATIKGHVVSDGALVEPSLHYQTDVALAGSEPDPGDVADAIWSHIGGGFLSLTSTQIRIDELVVLEQTVPPLIGVAGAHTINQLGTQSAYAGELPRALCPILNFHTDTRSRSARGWTFMPQITAAAYYSGGLWSAAFQTSMNDFAALLDDSMDLGAINPTHLNPVVYSRTRHLRGQDPYTFRVKTVKVNPRPGYLRSRLSAP